MGPLLGALLAVLLYRLLKLLEYETVNPDADGDGRQEVSYRNGGSVTSNAGTSKSGLNLNKYQCTDSSAHGNGTTDGTFDEVDFASRIRTAKHGPHHNVALTKGQTNSTCVSEPMPVFNTGHDGHHSRVTSDRSYRSGPSVESGSS